MASRKSRRPTCDVCATVVTRPTSQGMCHNCYQVWRYAGCPGGAAWVARRRAWVEEHSTLICLACHTQTTRRSSADGIRVALLLVDSGSLEVLRLSARVAPKRQARAFISRLLFRKPCLAGNSARPRRLSPRAPVGGRRADVPNYERVPLVLDERAESKVRTSQGHCRTQ
jgi:hypothetical protein